MTTHAIEALEARQFIGGEWVDADAVLGGVGGSAKVDGAPASDEAAADRLEVLHD